MRDRSTLDQKGDFRSIELIAGIMVFGEPVNFDCWQALNSRTNLCFDGLFDHWLVSWEDVCKCPSVYKVSTISHQYLLRGNLRYGKREKYKNFCFSDRENSIGC